MSIDVALWLLAALVVAVALGWLVTRRRRRRARRIARGFGAGRARE